MARVIGRLFQTLHRSSRLASTADLEDHVRGQDVILFTLLMLSTVWNYSFPCNIFRCLVVNWFVKLKFCYFASATLMVGCMNPTTFNVDYLLCIDPMKTVVNQGPTGFLTDSGLIRFSCGMTLNLRDLDNRN